MRIATCFVHIINFKIFTVLAWAILPLDFRIEFGIYDFRPWRLLTIIYGSLFVVSALLISFGPESPKFLLSQGRQEETLEILKTIYSKNKGKSRDKYPVRK